MNSEFKHNNYKRFYGKSVKSKLQSFLPIFRYSESFQKKKKKNWTFIMDQLHSVYYRKSIKANVFKKVKKYNTIKNYPHTFSS